MEKLLKQIYGLDPIRLERSSIGVGADTYFVTCEQGKYVIKYPVDSVMEHPLQEPELCAYLNEKGIPACRFLKNLEGEYISRDLTGRVFHVQQFLEGQVYSHNAAPSWLLTQSAKLLGKIHNALRDRKLPEGIGKAFFSAQVPARSQESYRHSLQIAVERGENSIAEDLRYRIDLMDRLPIFAFDSYRLTLCATHGDYRIDQLLCGDGKINAVIDWTVACVHPVVWEIIRSFVYASPECAQGRIDAEGLMAYIRAYRSEAPLTDYDLESMVHLFYYQLAVCDYYGQYFASKAPNRQIFLQQAEFSTKLLRWLDQNAERLTDQLIRMEQ